MRPHRCAYIRMSLSLYTYTCVHLALLRLHFWRRSVSSCARHATACAEAADRAADRALSAAGPCKLRSQQLGSFVSRGLCQQLISCSVSSSVSSWGALSAAARLMRQHALRHNHKRAKKKKKRQEKERRKSKAGTAKALEHMT